MPDITIHDLAHFPDGVPVIANWFYDELPELCLNQTREELKQCVGKWLATDRIPTALVAVSNGRLIGFVALKDKDKQFGVAPWLAGMYVVPQFRHCGVGEQLLRAAEDKARSIGLCKLYLFAPKSHSFYGACGWDFHYELDVQSTQARIMEKLLTPQNPFQKPPPAMRG